MSDVGATDPLLAVYLLVEPLVAERVILDVGPRPPGGLERLRRAGAERIEEEEGGRSRLSALDASVDVVVCVARLGAVSDEIERQRWFAELRRVLKPGGFCVLRVPADVWPAFEPRLRDHFATVQVVAETPLQAISFSIAGIEDVAVNEAISPIAGTPSHLVVFCTPGDKTPWQLPESLLVPVGGPGTDAPDRDRESLRAELAALTARHQAACRERDELRETAAGLEDEGDRKEEALSSLRRAIDRQLGQASELASALEMAALDRQQADRRAASAERALETLSAEAQRLRAELAALREP